MRAGRVPHQRQPRARSSTPTRCSRRCEAGQLVGAGLDVVEGEPDPPRELVDAPRTSSSPRTSPSRRTRRLVELRRRAAEEVVRVLAASRRATLQQAGMSVRDRRSARSTPGRCSTAAAGRRSRREVTLDDGTLARASVPSGASTGKAEARRAARRRRDRWEGRGVGRAVAHVRGEIAAPRCSGRDALDQRGARRGDARRGRHRRSSRGSAPTRMLARQPRRVPGRRRGPRAAALPAHSPSSPASEPEHAAADGQHPLRRAARRPRHGRAGLPRRAGRRDLVLGGAATGSAACAPQRAAAVRRARPADPARRRGRPDPRASHRPRRHST